MGVKSNFSELMEISSAPYIMFSDQDDVWMPYKLESSLEEMLRLEKFYGNQPYLIHSDLSVVDEQLQPIDPSFGIMPISILQRVSPQPLTEPKCCYRMHGHGQSSINRTC